MYDRAEGLSTILALARSTDPSISPKTPFARNYAPLTSVGSGRRVSRISGGDVVAFIKQLHRLLWVRLPIGAPRTR
jgi:hypothetical protein